MRVPRPLVASKATDDFGRDQNAPLTAFELSFDDELSKVTGPHRRWKLFDFSTFPDLRDAHQQHTQHVS